MIFHKYDTQPILLTVPQIYEAEEPDQLSGPMLRAVGEYKHRCKMILLNEVKR